jgi:hypothetical protein
MTDSAVRPQPNHIRQTIKNFNTGINLFNTRPRVVVKKSFRISEFIFKKQYKRPEDVIGLK